MTWFVTCRDNQYSCIFFCSQSQQKPILRMIPIIEAWESEAKSRESWMKQDVFSKLNNRLIPYKSDEWYEYQNQHYRANK